jgi:hypothetical protein
MRSRRRWRAGVVVETAVAEVVEVVETAVAAVVVAATAASVEMGIEMEDEAVQWTMGVARGVAAAPKCLQLERAMRQYGRRRRRWQRRGLRSTHKPRPRGRRGRASPRPSISH